MHQWAKDWLMRFNLSKCEHLTILVNKQLPILSNYIVNNCVSNKVNSSNYLGVTIIYYRQSQLE